MLDASRVVNVASSLLSPENKPGFLAEVRREAGTPARGIRRAPFAPPAAFARRRPAAAARRSTGPKPTSRARSFSARASSIPCRSMKSCLTSTGDRSSVPGSCADAFPTCSRIRPSAPRRPSCTPTRRDCSARIVAEKRYIAKAVIGFWPANAVGDDIEVYADEQRSRVLTTFHCLRQQHEKPAGQFNHSLADFIAPKDSRPARLSGRLRRHRRPRRRPVRRGVPRPARRLFGHHGAGAGRPPGRGAGGADAQEGPRLLRLRPHRETHDGRRSSAKNTAASAPRPAIRRVPTTRRSACSLTCSAPSPPPASRSPKASPCIRRAA